MLIVFVTRNYFIAPRTNFSEKVLSFPLSIFLCWFDFRETQTLVSKRKHTQHILGVPLGGVAQTGLVV